MLDAKERWTRLNGRRSAALDRARDAAKLTIPAILPPEGSDDNTPLPQPYQSLGARGVNNLGSKLLIALMPPGQSAFRLQIDAAVRESLGEQVTEAEQKLSKMEQRATAKVEAMGLRPLLFEVLTHLIVTGNVLFNKARSGARMYRFDQFVCSRDPSGNPVEAVVQETVSPTAITDDVALACDVDKSKPDTKVTVYTVIEWMESRVKEWQEINGKLVPGSVGYAPKKRSRWLPLRWRAVPGNDYGRGHVEEYMGDLRSLEGLSMSIVQFAAAASKILFGVRPGATTKIDDIFKAQSGDAFTGLKEDIWILQLEKFADFQVAKTTADDISLRLSHAFLLRSGTVRDAERVTAEEVRALAQELDDALGGTYTVLGEEFQLPFARLLLAEMQAAKELPPMPEGVVDPVIVTGFAALGRNHAVNRLRNWLGDVAAMDPTLESVNKPVVAKRLGIGHGVEDLDELIKSPEQMEQEAQRRMAQEAVSKAAGPVAGALAKQQ